MKAATDFLKLVTPPGKYMTVVAIDPLSLGKCIGRGFDADSLADAAAFIRQHTGSNNLYWSPNPLVSKINKKPKKEHVAEMARAYVDIDNNVDTALERLRSAPLLPTIIVFSGGGYQAFWDLRQPITINGNLTELEATNQHLIEYFGGDKSAWNLDRIMRLPGTTNWPTKTKLAKGRTGPVQAELIEHHPERVYELSEFQVFAKRLIAVVEAPTKDERKVEPARKSAPKPDLKNAQGLGDQSRAMLGQIRHEVRSGKTDEEIHALYDSHTHAIRQANPARAVQRCINEIRATPSFALTDLGNSDRLIAAHGDDLRYLVGAGWHIWEGHRFVPDRTQHVKVVMGRVARGIYAEAAEADDLKRREALGQWAKQSESRARIESALSLAQAQPEVADLIENYDVEPLLVGMPNGVYDLGSDKFRDGRRDDRITLSINVKYDPAARCPRWEQFQREIHEDDADVATFKQRAWGYTLSGDCSEQVLFITWGDGANGKTTEQNVLFDILGDHSCKIEPETLLMKNRQGAASNDIARLRGARYIGTEETGDGKRLAENLVKQLTGKNRLTARFLYQEFFEFTVRGKIWIATNHRPEITGTDYAIWRRIVLVPYRVQFAGEQRDPHLESKLLAERPGILNWLIEGFRQWRKIGLAAPARVIAATEQYRQDMDRIAGFLKECCQLNAKGSTKCSNVYRCYCLWCRDNGHYFLSSRKFHERMERDHHLTRVKDNTEKYVGLLLTATEYRDADM